MTEKDQAASKRPWFDAGLGKLGSRADVQPDPAGRDVIARVAHPAAQASLCRGGAPPSDRGSAKQRPSVEGRIFTPKPPIARFRLSFEIDYRCRADTRHVRVKRL